VSCFLGMGPTIYITKPFKYMSSWQPIVMRASRKNNLDSPLRYLCVYESNQMSLKRSDFFTFSNQCFIWDRLQIVGNELPLATSAISLIIKGNRSREKGLDVSNYPFKNPKKIQKSNRMNQATSASSSVSFFFKIKVNIVNLV
jgi:hypothetical protein